jgi:hypothetical protein
MKAMYKPTIPTVFWLKGLRVITRSAAFLMLFLSFVKKLVPASLLQPA